MRFSFTPAPRAASMRLRMAASSASFAACKRSSHSSLDATSTTHPAHGGRALGAVHTYIPEVTYMDFTMAFEQCGAACDGHASKASVLG